jgi:hypothetical protein
MVIPLRYTISTRLFKHFGHKCFVNDVYSTLLAHQGWKRNIPSIWSGKSLTCLSKSLRLYKIGWSHLPTLFVKWRKNTFSRSHCYLPIYNHPISTNWLALLFKKPSLTSSEWVLSLTKLTFVYYFKKLLLTFDEVSNPAQGRFLQCCKAYAPTPL